MKTPALLALMIILASPARGVVIHDETIQGDLATDASAPTALLFVPGGNTIIGTVNASAAVGGDRDYITFSIPSDQILSGLVLHAYTPDNLGFAAFNSGTTSYIPGAGTAANFLAGIHPGGADVGTDLMPLFVSASVTGNSLASPMLGAGDYCFMIQQTSPLTTSYTLEFILDFALSTEPATWGALKALYRR